MTPEGEPQYKISNFKPNCLKLCMWEQFLSVIRVYGNIENSKPKCYANLLAR